MAIQNFREFSFATEKQKEGICTELLEVAIDETRFDFVKAVLDTGYKCDT